MFFFYERLYPHFTALLFVFTTFSVAQAQIDVTYPVERIVFQRDNANNCTFQVAGSFTQPVDRVEARVVPRAAGQGTATDWALVQANPAGGVFNGQLTARGGWYRLEVRGIRGGNVVATDSVRRVGVGEVFAFIGHSNSQGTSCNDANGVDRCVTAEGAADERVVCVPVDAESAEFKQYEQTANTNFLPGLDYGQLLTRSGLSPFSKIAWNWGRTGEVLVQRLGVPVAFYSAGFGGTTIEHCYKSAYDIPFEHSFVRYDLRMPIANLRNILRMYVPATGLRAILVIHGENDRYSSFENIRDWYKGTMVKMREEFGYPRMAWVNALSSYVGQRHDNVRSAQFNATQETPDAFLGPDLDDISSWDDRPDGIHYSTAGQRKIGELWANHLATPANGILPVEGGTVRSQPILPRPQPLTRISCATNNQLTLRQPDGYTEFRWNTGETTQSITKPAGTYGGRVKSANLMVAFPPAVTTAAAVRPNAPAISAGGPPTLCAGETLTLTSNYDGPNRWSTGATTRSIQVQTTGTYSVEALDAVYSCPSDRATQDVATGKPDLALTVQSSQRTVAVNDTLTYTLLVRNDGCPTAATTSVQNRLPANVAFVSSDDLSHASGVVSGSVPALTKGASATRRYRARITQAGYYVNAAEITASDPDADSQPNTGTADGEDDAAQVELRTAGGGGSTYVSPNPNGRQLPPVQPNQPTPDADRADLSLLMNASQRAASAGQQVTFTIILANRGSLTATNISVRDELPAGWQFVSSSTGMTATGNVVTGTVAQLAAGAEVTLSFVATVSGSGRVVNAAQISAADQPDPDSRPNNGTTNGEDDTAQTDLRLR